MRARSPRRSLRARLAASARRLRSARGWTQEEAAEAASLNPRHYQKIEEGSVNLTLNTLERLSAAFGVDVRELFGS
jgi:transcriptional regulator with XRE-family HTH domain